MGRWPCGLVIEVGPVPQGVLAPAIVNQTRLALESALKALERAARRQCGGISRPTSGRAGKGAVPAGHRRGWW